MNKSFANFPSLSSRFGVVLLVLTVWAGGCGPAGVKSYTVPKESAAQTMPAEMPASAPDLAAPSAGPQLKWKTPAGWQEIPPGTMRVASFKVAGADGKQADVSVIPLPGGAGGDFSNVNRWRGQVGLAPVDEVELAKLAQPVTVAGQPAALYEQAGDAIRILAVIQHREGTAWFFKMTGDSQLVAQSKPAFVDFLQSVQFINGATPPAQSPAASGELPAGHPDLSGPRPAAVPAVLSNEGKPSWTVPAGWQEVSGGQFLIAKFIIAGADNAPAAVNVSSSAGNGGGLAANVNRWRKQLGLSELAGDELAKSVQSITTAAGPATLVEMAGTDARTSQPAALVGIIVLRPEQAWFFKLMGAPAVVNAQKDRLIEFVRGVKY